MLTLRPLSVTVTEPVGVPPCDMISASVGIAGDVVLLTTTALASAATVEAVADDELGSEEDAPTIRSC